MAPDLTAEVLKVWNSYKIDGRNLPGLGYATHRLKVINAPAGKPLSLRIPTFSTAYELYINDRLLSSNGKIGADKEHFSPGYMPRIAEFTPEESSFEIIVHISNFTYARGGMWYAINMYTPQQIRAMDKAIADKELFLYRHKAEKYGTSLLATYSAYICDYSLILSEDDTNGPGIT